MSDASAACPSGDGTLVIADDEDNTLRVYGPGGGGPVGALPLDEHLGVSGVEHPEADIEGAALLGDTCFWITSHGRNRKGKWRPARHHLFATSQLRVVGATRRDVGAALATVPELAAAIGPEGERAPGLAPKVGGLNIEGLAAGPDGASLLIGLRNPLVDGRAVVVTLRNPDQVVNAGAAPELGEPILLRLEAPGGGPLGVRSIGRGPSGYLVAAGPRDGRAGFALFAWSGRPDDAPRLLPRATDRINGIDGFAPEALVPLGDEVLLLSDDGTRRVEVASAAGCAGALQDGRCRSKDLVDRRRRVFRGLRVEAE